MAPQMGAPPEMGMAPPMGMADGGIASLPVPDAMFDEPTNGGYAGGGIVAFAEGGISDLYDDVEYWESGGKQGAVSPKGARGVMQLMPDTMRDPGFGVRPMQADTEEENRRVGQEYLDAMYRRYGDKKVALAAYNWGPGKVDKWLESGADPKKLPAETRKYIANIMGGKDNISVPERDIGTAEGRVMAPLDIFEALQSRFGPNDEEKGTDARVRARAEEMASPEFYEKQRKASMYETLAEIGFNMASSKSPFLLQAVGEAAAAAMPGAKVARKEREQLKDRALDVMQAMNDKSRKENRELLGVAIDMAKTGMSQEQFEQKLALDERQVKLAEDKLDAEIDAAKKAGADPEKVAASYVLNFAEGTPQYEAGKRYYDLRYGSREGRTSGPEDLRARIEAATKGEGGSGGIKEGTRSADTKGKPIVYSGGQWVYEE